MIKLPPDLEFTDLPVEKQYHSTVRGLLTRIRKLYEAIEDRFGEDGLALIEEISRDYGSEIAARVRERQDELSLHETGKFLLRVFNGVRAEGEVTEWNDDRVIIAVPRCPYPFTRPEICAAHTTMEEALVHGLNPTLRYEIERCIPRGDSECWHVLSR